MRRILALCVLTLLCLNWSCAEDEAENTFVVTEEILHLSGDQIRMMGRIISNQQIAVTDHGFYLATDSGFQNPIVVSLGEKSGPGRFVGEANSLESGQTYFLKSFIERGGELSFGDVMELETLEAFIDSYSPSFGSGGADLVIVGGNFTEETQVFFGDQKAQVKSIEFESRLTVVIPAPVDQAIVPIKIVIEGESYEFDQRFEYQAGRYSVISTFPEEIKLYDNVFFQKGNGLYFGLGTANKQQFLTYFQRYDVESDTWAKIDFPGSSRSYAFFTDNYIGGGTAVLGSNPIVINNSFWRITDSGFQRLTDLPFESRESLALEINQALYVFGSKQLDGPSLWKYEPGSGQWSQLSSPPAEFDAEAASFTYQGMIYLIALDQSIWRFDPVLESWEMISVYPGSMGQGYGMAKVVGDKVYVGLFRRSNEMWELDMKTLSWKSKNPMPGYPQSIVVGHFVKGEVLYIMRIPEFTLPGTYPMDLYRFDPEGI